MPVMNNAYAVLAVAILVEVLSWAAWPLIAAGVLVINLFSKSATP